MLYKIYRLTRMDKPAGSLLLFLPCLMGIAAHIRYVGRWWEDGAIYALLLLFGSFAMRSSGCIINDIIDRDIDAKVERTASRPLASGEVSLAYALIVLAALLLCGLAVLVALPMRAVITSLCYVPLVLLYPFMKRIIAMPQIFLGVTFNAGVLVGWACLGAVSLPAILIYLACICWTIAYDTIYAYQDIRDDMQVGVKSSAIFMGGSGKWWIFVLYTVMIALFLAVELVYGDAALLYIIIIILAYMHLLWQVITLDVSDARGCMARFKSNIYTGAMICAALITG